MVGDRRTLFTCNDGTVHSLASVIPVAGIGRFEAEVFGTMESSEVAAVLASLAATATGVEVVGGLWYCSSTAAVAGVVLEDGRSVVVRAYQRSASSSFIEGVVRAQDRLASAGFPCARPLSGPVVVDGILGRVESLLPDPGPRRFEPGEMNESARGLARVVSLAATVDPAGLDRHPMALPDTQLYPSPHSPLFDFDATASGAEWIDEIASAARRAMTDVTPVIAHGDWSARNVRLGPGGLLGAYDWESLQHGPETTAVGVAAATWRSLGEPHEPMAPSADEIMRYVTLYEAGREGPFTARQRRSARAAAAFALAYTARCEHALDPGTRTGRASERLATDDHMQPLLE